MLYSDAGFGEDDHPEPEDFAAPHTANDRKPASSTSVLVAAFSGLMLALGWEEPPEETTIMATTDADKPDWLNLDFGPLEPLDQQQGKAT